MSKGQVLVAMSGGVDSSVAAHLLIEEGYECIGVTMLLHGDERDPQAQENTCCSLKDVEDARQVAHELGITHYAFDFSDEFHESVVRDFVEAYKAGLTPNPCAVCNRRIKFGALLRRARELGCDYLATGHYARVVVMQDQPVTPGDASHDAALGRVAAQGPAKTGTPAARYLLAKAVDHKKDQSYFLGLLTQRQLTRTLLPLGGLTKEQVRAIASDLGLPNARKRESQDICFVPDGDVRGFLERYSGVPFQEGDVLDTNGNVIGKHGGAMGYTIGQRKGLGVALGSPAYVCARDVDANTVTIGGIDSILSTTFVVNEWNWVAPPASQPRRAKVRTHYRMTEQPATLTPIGDGSVEVTFDAPVRAITPGQLAVAYDGDTVVGAGTIARTRK